MQSVIVEATQDIKAGPNWGKFLVARFDDEWARLSLIDNGRPLLAGQCHLTVRHILVMDLQTHEGMFFLPAGTTLDTIAREVRKQMMKHCIWVCPLYQPFAEWLFGQPLGDLAKLPKVAELPGADGALYGHRRPGKGDGG